MKKIVHLKEVHVAVKIFVFVLMGIFQVMSHLLNVIMNKRIELYIFYLNLF